MTPVARRVVWSLVAAVVILGAGVAALVTFWPRGPQGVPPQLVPAAWAQYRTSPGHAFHVSQGKAECRDCHDVERDGFKSPGTDVCKKCHVKESARAHQGGPGLAATSCLTCHQFAPGLPAPTCIGCHAKPEGDLSAVVQHATAECTKCHRPHDDPSIVPADCASCHDERATKHGEHAGSKGCLDCHGAHRPATAATVACSSCHAQPAGPHPAGHDSCIGCHQPHDFVAGGEQACIRCHGEKTTLAANVAPAHAICTSCHTPHDPARAATGVRPLPPGHPGRAWSPGSLRHLPQPARRRRRGRRGLVHELPREGRRVRYRRPRRRRRVRGVPQASSLRGAEREGPLRELPRARDHTRRDKRGSRRLQVLSWRGGGPCASAAGGVRHLPPRRGEVCARRPPALRRLSRAACRATPRDLRDLSRGQDRRPARDHPGRLRDVPSPPRS